MERMPFSAFSNMCLSSLFSAKKIPPNPPDYIYITAWPCAPTDFSPPVTAKYVVELDASNHVLRMVPVDKCKLPLPLCDGLQAVQGEQ